MSAEFARLAMPPSKDTDADPQLSDAERLDGVTILVVMPSVPLGGMERANVEILRELRARGARILVLIQGEIGDLVKKACEAAGCECLPVSVHCALRKPRGPRELIVYCSNWLGFVFAVWRTYRQVRPDWVYVTNLSYVMYSWPLLWAIRQRVIFCLPTPPLHPGNRLRASMSRWIWRNLVIPVCNRIVCNSHFTKGELLATGAKPKSLEVIDNFLPLRRATIPSDAPQMSAKRVNVVYIGRLAPVKGVRELVQVARQIVQDRNDVDFYLTGDYQWNNSFAMDLVQGVRYEGLDHRIVFTGEIEDIPGLLSGADIHVLFSDREAYGLAVLEAKSKGVPSVVSSRGALPELVTHQADGYVCKSLTEESLRAGLDYFLSDTELRRRAGESAASSMCRFDRLETTSRWVRVFRLR